MRTHSLSGKLSLIAALTAGIGIGNYFNTKMNLAPKTPKHLGRTFWHPDAGTYITEAGKARIATRKGMYAWQKQLTDSLSNTRRRKLGLKPN
jgi:hypothetical protein